MKLWWYDWWSYDITRNVVIFGVDNGWSSHSNNQKNYFLVLGEGPNKGIDVSIGAGEKKLVLTLGKKRQNFVWVCITTLLIVICM